MVHHLCPLIGKKPLLRLLKGSPLKSLIFFVNDVLSLRLEKKQTVQKSPKLVYVHTNVSYASRTLLTFKSHPKCLKACLIVLSNGPHLVSLQGSKLGHSAVIHYIILLS